MLITSRSTAGSLPSAWGQADRDALKEVREEVSRLDSRLQAQDQAQQQVTTRREWLEGASRIVKPTTVALGGAGLLLGMTTSLGGVSSACLLGGVVGLGLTVALSCARGAARDKAESLSEARHELQGQRDRRQTGAEALAPQVALWDQFGQLASEQAPPAAAQELARRGSAALQPGKPELCEPYLRVLSE